MSKSHQMKIKDSPVSLPASSPDLSLCLWGTETITFRMGFVQSVQQLINCILQTVHFSRMHWWVTARSFEKKKKNKWSLPFCYMHEFIIWIWSCWLKVQLYLTRPFSLYLLGERIKLSWISMVLSIGDPVNSKWTGFHSQISHNLKVQQVNSQFLKFVLEAK